MLTPPSFKVRGATKAEANLLLNEIRLAIRRFLNKGAIYPNLLLVYLLYEPTVKDGGVSFRELNIRIQARSCFIQTLRAFRRTVVVNR